MNPWQWHSSIEQKETFWKIMSIREASLGTIKRGARNVTRNPTRLALIVALLGTGLMFVAAMFALNGSAAQRLQAARNEIGTGIDIRPAGSFGAEGDSSKSLSLAQLQAAEHVPGVVGAVESILKSYDKTDIKGSIQGQGGKVGSDETSTRTLPPYIYGFTPGLSQYPLFTGDAARITAGRNLSAADTNQALTSQAMADANGWHIGSTFSIEGTTVTLVGIFATSNSDLSDNAIIIPIQTARTIYNVSGATQLTVYAANDTIVPGIVNQLKGALGKQFDVVSQASSYTSVLNALQSAQNNIFATLAAAIITTALIIVFAVMLIVRERVQEIGLLKAIGASHWQVVSQFGIEVLTLSGIAAIIAAILLAVLGPLLASKFDINTAAETITIHQGGGGAFVGKSTLGQQLHSASHTLSAGLTPGTLALILLVGIGLAVLSSAVPAWYVARVRPADVLRAE
jgi:putative ABC transport system permease protein